MARRRMPSTAGAVYVEFLIAFVPLFVMFMALVQLAFVEVGNLIVKHSAVLGARAAAVVLVDVPSDYADEPIGRASGKRLSAIEQAVKIPLFALSNSPEPRVSFPSAPGANDSKSQFAGTDVARVRVDFDFRCRIPVGRTLACNPLTGTKRVSGEAAMPIFGANYAFEK
jgi:hypothetical protein